MKRFVAVTLLVFLLLPGYAYAYDGATTHLGLTQRAAEAARWGYSVDGSSMSGVMG